MEWIQEKGFSPSCCLVVVDSFLEGKMYVLLQQYALLASNTDDDDDDVDDDGKQHYKIYIA